MATAAVTLGFALGTGAFCLVDPRWFSANEKTISELLYGWTVFGTAFLAAALLFSGEGGKPAPPRSLNSYSLRLPVSTTQVLISNLLVRTVCLAASGIILWTAYTMLAAVRGGGREIFLLLVSYLALQGFAWSRRIWTYLAGIAGLALALFLFVYTSNHEIPAPTISGPLLLLLLFGSTLAIGVSSHNAIRHGRTLSFKQLLLACEWPRSLSHRAAFQDRNQAQRWYFFRQSSWLLVPLAAAASTVLCLLCLLLRLTGTEAAVALVPAFLPYALPAAALLSIPLHAPLLMPMSVHGSVQARTRAYLLPFALAFLLVNLLTVAFFLLQREGAAWQVIAGAVSSGLTNPREVIATFLGLPLLLTLVAWTFLHATARIGIYVASATGLLPVLTLVVAAAFELTTALDVTRLLDTNFATFAFSFLAVFSFALTAGLLFLTWRQRLLPGVYAMKWVGIWLFLAALLFPVQTLQSYQPSWEMYGIVAIASLGWTSPLPMMMAGLHLDLNALRHGADVAQEGRSAARWRARPLAPKLTGALLLVAIALFLVWLRWPAEPAYCQHLRQSGSPATLQELDASYPRVPDDQNPALVYLDIFTEAQAREQALYSNGNASTPVQHDWISRREALLETIPIVGEAKLERGDSLPAEMREASQEFSLAVSGPISKALIAQAREPVAPARYPIDLKQGYNIELPHLMKLRALARYLSLESLLAADSGDTETATNAILAIFPLARSLEAEPLYISQLVRAALLSIAIHAQEEALNRAAFSDQQLRAMERSLQEALPPLDAGMFLRDALAGDYLSAISMDHASSMLKLGENLFTLPIRELVAFEDVTRLLHGHIFAVMMREAESPGNRAPLPLQLHRTVDEFPGMRAQIAALLVEHAWPAGGKMLLAEWRIRAQLRIAATALAVERYRLAEGALPGSLEDLVPAYLDAVPVDPFGNGTLRYRIKPNGEFVVYSFGQDREDDLGEELEDSWKEGDITFTVPLPEARRAQVDQAQTR